MTKWPTVSALSAATEEEINEAWSGLGYYRRGRNLHAGAKMVMSDFGGQIPTTAAELKKLPGVYRRRKKRRGEEGVEEGRTFQTRKFEESRKEKKLRKY